MSGEGGWACAFTARSASRRHCAHEDWAWPGQVPSLEHLVLPPCCPVRYVAGSLAASWPGRRPALDCWVGVVPHLIALLLRVLPQGVLRSFPVPGAILVYLYKLQ